MKPCIKCKETKELKEFRSKRNDCKECEKIYQKEYQNLYRFSDKPKKTRKRKAKRI